MSDIQLHDDGQFTVTVFGDYSYTGTFYSAVNEYVEDAQSASESLCLSGKYGGIQNKFPLAAQEQVIIELWKTIPKNLDDGDYMEMVSQLALVISFFVSGDIDLFFLSTASFDTEELSPTGYLIKHKKMLKAICGPVTKESYVGSYWTQDDVWVGEDEIDEVTDRDRAEAEWRVGYDEEDAEIPEVEYEVAE